MTTRPRVTFLVNGTPGSPMGERAHAFADRLADRYAITLHYRDGGKLSSLVRFVAAIQTERPDLSYVLDMAYSGVLAAAAGRLHVGVPVVIDTGDAITDLARAIGRSQAGVLLTRGLEVLSLRLAAGLVVRGSYHQQLLARRGIASTVVHDGVDRTIFTPRDVPELRRRHRLDGVVTVGLVGSSVWNPRQQTCYGWDLVEAVRRVRDLPVHGVLIGGGSGIPILQERCRTCGISDRIHFLDYRPYAELPCLLNLLDIALSTQSNDIPGWVRTTGKLPLYLATGRYVLASQVGEATRVLPDEMLVDYHGQTDPDYPGRLAERIRGLVERPERLRVAEAQVARAAAFDYDRLAEQLNTVFSAALGATRPHVQSKVLE